MCDDITCIQRKREREVLVAGVGLGGEEKPKSRGASRMALWWSRGKITKINPYSSATRSLLTRIFLVRAGDHARVHREQRGPRSGRHGGRFSTARDCQQRVHNSGSGGRGGSRGRAVRRRVAHLTRPRLLLPLVPAVLGPVQVPVLVEHQADAGRVQPVGFPERRGGVQFLFGHLEQNGTVTERYGHTAQPRVLQNLRTRRTMLRTALSRVIRCGGRVNSDTRAGKRATTVRTLKHSSFSM